MFSSVSVALIEITLLAILPIALLQLNIIPKKFRLVLLGIIFLLVLLVVYAEEISASQLGFRLDNFRESLLPFSVLTVVGIICLAELARRLKKKRAVTWYEDPHFLFLFIPLSFAQQFLFQGFLLYKLNIVFPAVIAVIVTAVLFGLMHTIYPQPFLAMILGTLGGLAFGVVYTFFPNLWVASLAHAILNFTAVYLSFFTFLSEDGRPRKTELHLR